MKNRPLNDLQDARRRRRARAAAYRGVNAHAYDGRAMERWLPNSCRLTRQPVSVNRVNKAPTENKLLPEKAEFIRSETHDHVLQSTLGQPAVEEHGDEDVPYGGPEYLWKVRRLAAAAGIPLGCDKGLHRRFCQTRMGLSESECAESPAPLQNFAHSLSSRLKAVDKFSQFQPAERKVRDELSSLRNNAFLHELMRKCSRTRNIRRYLHFFSRLNKKSQSF